MWYVIIFAATLLLDQISKILTDGAPDSVFIKGIIDFKSVYNTGASFSLFADKPWAQDFFLVLTAVVLLGGGIYVIFSKKKSKWLNVAIALLFSGAIGNFIDRLAFEYVRDFISFAFFNFPTFNVADVCLCVGVAMLVIFLLFIDDEGIFSGNDGEKGEKANKNGEVALEASAVSEDGLNDCAKNEERGLKAKSLYVAKTADNAGKAGNAGNADNEVNAENGDNALSGGTKNE